VKNVLYFLSVLLICYAQSYAEEGASCHKLTITVSPFRLLNPELYLSGEKPLSRKVTIAAMIGAGRITNENITCSIMGIGGQIRYCLIDSFSHGVMIGPDIGYVGLGAQIEDPIG